MTRPRTCIALLQAAAPVIVRIAITALICGLVVWATARAWPEDVLAGGRALWGAESSSMPSSVE